MGNVTQYPQSGGGLSAGTTNITGDTTLNITGVLSLNATTALTISSIDKIILARGDGLNDTQIELGLVSEGTANMSGAHATAGNDFGVTVSLTAGDGAGLGEGGSLFLAGGYDGDGITQRRLTLSGGRIDLDGPMQLEAFTTADRDAIVGLVNGAMLYNSDAGAIQAKLFKNGATGWFSQALASDSQVQASDDLGNGSTNTCIRHFGTSVEATGSDITMTLSATNGDSFTINADGIYSISYFDAAGSAGWLMGLSKNASGADLTTSIGSISASKVLGIVNPRADDQQWGMSWTGKLLKNDVIRMHNSGADAPQPGSHTRAHITVSQIIKL